jgi:hypothetical protein
MKMPHLGWLQGPWSPVGYDVVELADKATPATCSQGRSESPDTPWSPLGYQVVEVSAPSRPAVPPPSPQADSALDRAFEELVEEAREEARQPQPQPRRLGRWAGLATGGACLVAAFVLMLLGLSAQARTVPTAEAPTQEVKSPSELADAPEGACLVDLKGPGRENFGTAVDFVRNTSEAGRAAEKQRKLMCVLHVSGNFEDAGFT